ncbi:MAG: DNA primase [Candidatus Omnitrophica bacterium]|nr:DNA primase [Candidatus Omnitrophota bacterium]
MIPEPVVRQIQDRLDIVEVIAGYLPLKRAGGHYKAVCPFHSEKTPSFMVNPTKQIFHCFGCGVGGDVISFVMKYEHLEFPEAIRLLAPKAGVEVPQGRDGPGAKPSDGAALQQAVEFAAGLFQRALHQPAGAAARAYLQRRGVTAASMEALRLGYAADSWDTLLTAGQAAGIAPAMLARAGLCVPRDGATGWYDRFRGRLMFPVWDHKGKVAGFGGRVLDESQPKYLNSPETEIYLKSRILYGLHLAAPHIREHDLVAIVEGYVDFLIPYQMGIRHLVASMGTSLTADQVHVLRRYTKRVVIVYDGDYAGELATLRGLDLLLSEGMSVRVVGLPPGEDPDSAARRVGADGFRRLLAEADDVFAYKLKLLRRRHDPATVEGKVAICGELLPTIKRVPNAPQASEYVRALADALKIREEDLRIELSRIPVKGVGDGPWRPRLAAGPPPAAATAEHLLLGIVLDDPRYWARVQTDVAADDLADAPVRAAFLQLAAQAERGPEAVAQAVQALKHGELASVVARALMECERTDDKARAMDDCIRRIRGAARRRKLLAKQAEIQAAESAGDEPQTTALIGEYNQLVKGSDSSWR